MLRVTHVPSGIDTKRAGGDSAVSTTGMPRAIAPLPGSSERESTPRDDLSRVDERGWS